MPEAAEVDADLRQSREQTVLAHLEAENRQDVAATLATFKPGAARTELPGEVADGPDAVAATYRELSPVGSLVEPRGFEPLTSALQRQRSTN